MLRPCPAICAAALALAPSVFAQQPEAPKLVPLPHPEIARPTLPAPVSSPWPLVAIGALTLALLGLVVWMLLRRKKRAGATSEVPPLSLAHRRLLELLQEIDKLPPIAVGRRVSAVIREYQMNRYRVPAPFRTREELYDAHEFRADTEREARFAGVALTCDQIAFAPAPATRAEAENLVKAAIETLRHEVFHAEGALPATVQPPPSRSFLPEAPC